MGGCCHTGNVKGTVAGVTAAKLYNG